MSELNRFELLFSDEAARALASRVGDDPLQFVEGQLARFVDEEDPMMLRIHQVTAEIEPYDDENGYGDDFQASNIFLMGGVLALSLAKIYLKPIHLDDMHDYDLGITIPIDTEAPDFGDKQRRSTAEHLLICREGWQMVSDSFETYINNWEDNICEDIMYQVYLRYGFGHTMYLAAQARFFDEQRQIQELAVAIENDAIDWGAVLKEWGDSQA